MPYFKLQLWRMLFMVLSSITMIFLLILLRPMYQKLTLADSLFYLSGILIADGAAILIFKKDLLSNKYKGTISYWFLKSSLYFDFIVGIPMIIVSVVIAIVKGIWL